MTRTKKWADKREQFVQWIEQGLSTDDMAAALGVTKNAVCGALWRLGLTKSPAQHWIDLQARELALIRTEISDWRFGPDGCWSREIRAA